MGINLDIDSWTYGCEHEFADWDREWKLPKGFGIDRNDVTIVNSNGIAADCSRAFHKYGGEINTPPSSTPEEQCTHLEVLSNFNVAVNYRSNLHIHIRVPGLRDDLNALKMIRQYGFANDLYVHNLLRQITHPKKEAICDRDLQYQSGVWLKAHRKRTQRCGQSHYRILSLDRINRQLRTRTVDDFFAAEVPCKSGGTPLWHLGTRPSVNLRQLRDTDTVEFRWFYGTLNSSELLAAIYLCRTYLHEALNSKKGPSAIGFKNRLHGILPTRKPFYMWQEIGYRATCVKYVTRAETEMNAVRIFNNKFDWYDPDNIERVI